jgi:hypothetical protein
MSRGSSRRARVEPRHLPSSRRSSPLVPGRRLASRRSSPLAPGRRLASRRSPRLLRRWPLVISSGGTTTLPVRRRGPCPPKHSSSRRSASRRWSAPAAGSPSPGSSAPRDQATSRAGSAPGQLGLRSSPGWLSPPESSSCPSSRARLTSRSRPTFRKWLVSRGRARSRNTRKSRGPGTSLNRRNGPRPYRLSSPTSGKSRRRRPLLRRSSAGSNRRLRVDLRFLGTIRSSPKLANGPILAVAVALAYGNFEGCG